MAQAKHGDTVRIHYIMADNAYGSYHDELVFVLDRDRFPENLQRGVGQDLVISGGADLGLRATVIDVSESSVTLDANHPLAEKDLTVDIQLGFCLKKGAI
jgi:peptidylprolyl isomerase